jgi:hypothetical protein
MRGLWIGRIERMEEIRNVQDILVAEPQGKRRPTCKLEGDIKIAPMKIVCNEVYETAPVQDMV